MMRFNEYTEISEECLLAAGDRANKRAWKAANYMLQRAQVYATLALAAATETARVDCNIRT